MSLPCVYPVYCYPSLSISFDSSLPHPTLRPALLMCSFLVFLVHVNVGSELREACSQCGNADSHLATFGGLVVGVVDNALLMG